MWGNTKKLRVIGAALIMFLAMITTVIGITIKSNTVNLVNHNVNNQVFEVNQIDELTIQITVNPPELKFSAKHINAGDFTVLELPNEGYTTNIGEAKLPTIARMIEIPQCANPEIVIESISWKQISLKNLNLPFRVIPVQPATVKLPGATEPFVINEKYYSKDIFSPEVTAKIINVGEMRERRFALVEISPVQYNPVSGKLNIMTVCNLRIDLHDSNIVKTSEKINRYSCPSFEKLFKAAFINYGFYEDMVGADFLDQEGYLIIVYDQFFEEIQPHANWKQTKGFDVTVTKTSQIPGGATKENIKIYIKDAYNNWSMPPTYVLLVGDVAQIPTWTGTSTGTAADLYYTTMNVGDIFADIIIGRFSASNEAQVTAMVDKTIYYEQGDFPSTEWIKKAVFMASNDNYVVSEGTHNYVIDTYLIPNGYTCDKLYCHTYSATTQQVKDALNNGRSLAIYSGHGSTTSWADGPPFSQSDVNSLTNTNMYPFVASHACVTGQFTVSECFAETWIRAPNKAGFAIWASSDNTYWTEDDVLEKKMFSAWWDDNIETIGGMTNMALYYLWQHYGGSGLSTYYLEAYILFGDPSVKIWRNDPSAPPETPSTPNGPDLGILNTAYSFTSSTTEPDEEDIYFLFDWGDGNNSGWLGPYTSGSTATASHSWGNIGDYEIKVTAKDIHNVQSGWSEPHIITIVENQPPGKPTITGPSNVKPGIQYLFKFNATDPDGDTIQYNVDWNDGNYHWYGPYNSGEEIGINHKWITKGTYTIQARAKDSFGNYGDWETYTVIVSFSMAGSHNNQMLQILLKNLVIQ